jgi:hypothetical protein
MEPTEAPRSEPLHNPYAPPGSRLDGPPPFPADGGGALSTLVLEHLKLTRPWVQLLAVLGFLGSGLMVIAGLMMTVLGSTGAFKASDNPFGAAFGAGLGVVYILIAFLYIMPSIYLMRYARSIKALLASPRVPGLEEALGHQKSFWRFVGICAAVVLGLYGIALVGVVVAAIVGAMAAS